MHLSTEIITPKGDRVKPYVTITTGDNGVNLYNLYIEGKKIGWLKLSVEKDHIYIGKMNNFSITQPLSARYTNVGRALHEIAFRESIRYGFDGRVEFIAETGTYLFHMSCGYIPCSLGKKDDDKKNQIEQAISAAHKMRREGLSAPFYNTALGSGPMFLLPDNIEKLKALYFAQHKKTPTRPTLQFKDARELNTKLLSPSEPGDQETWRQIESPPGLAAMDKEYLSGWVVGVYFSQTQSSKLKHMLSPSGLYAFSRFLIGWQDCAASYEETLQFILSDWGIQALEEGLVKAADFRGKFPSRENFTKEDYESLVIREISAKDLFVDHPIAKPQNAVRIGVV